MADDCRETDQQKIDSAINELAERKNGKLTAPTQSHCLCIFPVDNPF